MDNTPKDIPEGVAVIGMAGQFPGALNLRAFRDLLSSGKEGISRFDRAEQSGAGVSENELNDPNYVNARPIIDDATCFDHEFFGFNPASARLMDPQQRIMLQTAWHVFEDAGYIPGDENTITGVYTASTISSWLLHYIMDNENIRENHDMTEIMVLNDQDHLSTRLAYLLNLKGPALSLGSSCSSSLLAVEHAFRSLLNYQTDLALAGGVSIQMPQERGYVHREGGIQSSDGHCRAFDAKSDGTLFGNGCGVVLLKRLDDALEDGDSIYAVIRGAAANNDGADKVGYTAPSIIGQQNVIQDALELSGIDLQQLAFIEAHGTGTQMGDPIEIRALKRAYQDGNMKPGSVAIGSVKTNIGHLESASGIAGFIKACLSLHHREIYPSLNFSQPNPEIDFDASPFHVATKYANWPEPAQRCAGVSSFGMGGTNVHVVLQESPVLNLDQSAEASPAELVLLSAKSDTALENLEKNVTNRIATLDQNKLPGYARMSVQGRSSFSLRNAVAVTKGDHATSWAEPLAINMQGDVNTAFLFPGQSAQYVGMAHQLYQRFPDFREVFDRGADWIKQKGNYDIKALLFESGNPEEIHETQYSQLSLFLVEYSLSHLLNKLGVTPDIVAGHSLGEITAACTAGVMDFETGLELVYHRGRYMQQAPEGSMLSVKASEQEIESLLTGSLCISVYNAVDRLTISGTKEEIKDLSDGCDEAGIAYSMLHTSHAFHHQSMEAAAQQFGEAISSLKFSTPQKPVYSNIDGALYDTEEPVTPEYWVRQLLQPVRFDRIADQLLSAQTEKGLIHEVGPGAMLGALLKMHTDYGQSAEAVSHMPRPKEADNELLHFLQQLGSLWVAGHSINWNAYYRGYPVRKEAFENYPFDKNQHLLSFGESRKKPEMAHIMKDPSSETTNRISATVMSSEEHYHFIYQKLFDKIIQLSGRPSDELKADTHFLEFGLDSLTLVSINQFIKKTFDVKIPFRKLQDQYATLAALTDYLTTKVDPPVEEVAKSAGQQPVENGSMNSLLQQNTSAATDSRSSKERIINEQLEIMRRQLEVLDGGTPEITKNGEKRASEASADFLFGPLLNHPPKDAVPSGALSRDYQAGNLQRLLDEYIPKTNTSREHTQRYRKSLADSRMMQGYRQDWKELVYPPVLKRAEGSRVWDIDDNEYIDFVSGFGGLLLGHNPDFLQEAIYEELRKNSPQLSIHHDQAGPTAELVADITGHERVTFCNTGSEAVMTAMRLARLETGKDLIVFFENDYHGNFDEVLAGAHRENDRISARPFVGGIPGRSVQNVIILPYNHPESLEWIELHHQQIAGVMVEPVQSRHPEIQPKAFLHDLRELCDDKDMAMIIDEVVTGFRLAPGGAQQYFDVKADLATYGKIAANGMPIGIVAGDSRFMDGIDGGYWQYGDDSFPEHDQTFIGGTFRKHPLSLAAVRAVLQYINQHKDTLYAELKTKADRLSQKVQLLIDENAWPLQFNMCESMFYLQPLEGCPSFELLNFELLDRGIYFFGERPYYLTESHSDDDIDFFVDALEQSMQKLLDGNTPKLPKNGSSAAIGYPLTGAQKEIWLNTIHGSEASSAYNMLTHLKFDDNLKPDIFSKAYQYFLNLHDAFSLRFSEDGSRQFTGAAKADIIIKSKEEINDFTAYIENVRNEPFDLTSGPLYRAELVQTPDNQWHFLFCVHHIIFDGWSSDVMMHELSELYNRGVQEQIFDLEEPSDKYTEYIKTKAEEGIDSETPEFWKQNLKNPPSPLQWKGIKQRPPGRTFDAGRRTYNIGSKLVGDLQKVARSHRISLNTILLAAYALWLNRLSASKDIVVGLPVASQPQSGHERLVGHCTNMLPVRIGVDADETTADLFSRLHRQIQEIMEHGSIGYGEILKLCKIPSLPDRSPLIQTIFNLDKVVTRPDFKGTNMEPIPQNRSYSPFELAFDIQETSEGLFVQCDYLTSLFEAEQIDQWLGSFEYMLSQLTTSDDLCVNDVQLFDPEEEMRLLGLGQPSESVKTDKKSTLISCFRQVVEENSQREAVRLKDETLTYAELDQRSDALAIALNEQGIKKGDVVGLCLDRTPSLIIAIIGILKTGACYLPIDPIYPEERRKFIIEDSGADCVITDENYIESWTNIEVGVLSLSELLENIPENKEATFEMPMAEDRAYIIYTSGSTGQPKGVEVSHHNVVRLFKATDALFKFDKNDRWTLFHSYAFDLSVWEMWGALLYGGSLSIVPQWVTRSPDAFYQLLSEQKITVLNQTPSAFKMLASHEEFLESDQRLPLSLRYIIFGGEKLEFDTLRSWANTHGLEKPQLINMYGITETSVHSTYYPITESDINQTDSPIGKPLPDLEIFLLDENNRPVPEGFTGEICIAGDGVAKGYLNRDKLNKEKFQHVNLPIGPRRIYRSGDLARWSSGDGNLVYLHRKDHQIKIRGHRVEIGEIRQHIRACDQVTDAFVTVVEGGGTVSIAAFVVLNDQENMEKADAINAIRTEIQKQLPPYMMPAHWVPVDSLPLNSNGKVDVKKLPDVEKAREQLPNFEEPIGLVEKSIAGVWAEVLDCDKISRHDNYFELGGDSVTSIRITQRLRKEGWSCSYKQIFEYPSVARLAANLDEQQEEAGQWPEQKLNGKQNHGPELYGIQRWFFDHFDFPQWYHQLATLSFDELPETEQLLDALKMVVNRHQALQTGYKQKDGKWIPQHIQQPEVRIYTPGSDEDPQKLLTKALKKTDLASSGLVCAVRDVQHRQVHLAIHHLAVDALSWPIILDDLDKALEGKLIAEKQGPDLYQWVAHFHKHIDSNKLEDSLQYWCDSSWKKAAVPFYRDGKADKNKAEYRQISKQIDGVSQSQRADLYPTLLGALATAVESHIKKDAFAIDIEHHGRDSYFDLPSPEGMVGWFTSISPLLLKKPTNGWDDTKSIVRQLTKLPQNGRFFEYLRGHEEITAPHSCGILFNYLGKGQSSYKKKHFSAAPAKNVEEVNPEVKRPHLVEINIQQNATSFQLDLHYDSQVINEKEITTFVEQFSHHIQQICSPSAEQPSSYAEPEEAAFDMDEILAEIEIDSNDNI